MTISPLIFPCKLPIHGIPALLLTCLLAGACSSNGDDSPRGTGVDAGGDPPSSDAIDVAAFDLVANDTTLFAVRDTAVVAIAPESEEVTTLWEVPAPVKEDESHLALDSISLLFADAQYVLVRRSIQFLTEQGQPVSISNELWRVPTDAGEAAMISSSNDTRYFRGASIHGDQIFTNSAYTVFSMQLDSGEFVSGFNTADDGNWVSNPVMDSNDRLWFTRNSELYSAASTGGGTQLEPTLSVPGSFAQEARLFPSRAGDDLLVWAPGAGIYQVALGQNVPTSTTGFQDYVGSDLFLRASRVGDSLWICEFDGVVEVGVGTEPRLVHELSGACSLATIGDVVFIADGVSIQRVAVN